MAWTSLAKGSNAGNITMDVEYNIASVKRTSNTNVEVTYGVRFRMAGSYWTYNSVAAFCPSGGSRYYAFNSGSGASHTNSGTWYYANTSNGTTTETSPFKTNFTVSITQTSLSFKIGFGWNKWVPDEVDSKSVTVTFPTGATAPTGCWCSVSDVTETSCKLSGGYSSDGNASVTSTGYQYKKDGGSWTNCSSTLTGLDYDTKYYFRYYATNSQGTSYSDGSTNTTTYDIPYCNSRPDFTLGEDVTLGFYNPLKRKLTFSIIGPDGSETTDSDWTITGTTYSGISAASSVDKLYKSKPNDTWGYYRVKTTWNGYSWTSYNNTSKFYIKESTNKPEFQESNITNVRDTLLVDTITGDGSKIIKGHNKVKGNITKMTPKNHATGSRYVVNANATPDSQELSYDNGATKEFTFDNIKVNSFIVTAYDSRGFSNPKTKTIDLIDYSTPKVNNLTITRQNGLGNYATLYVDGTYTNWSNLKTTNKITKLWFRYKKSTDNNWTSWSSNLSSNVRSSNGQYSVSVLLDDVFEATAKYNFQVTVEDLLEESSIFSNTLSTANGFLWRDLKNKFLGINKKPTCALDVNGDINTEGKISSSKKIEVISGTTDEPHVSVSNGSEEISLLIGSGGINRGLYDDKNDKWILYKTSEGNLQLNELLKTIPNCYWFSNGEIGLDLRNSDVGGIDALIFSDCCDDVNEGIFIPKNANGAGSKKASDYDRIYSYNGKLHFNDGQVVVSKTLWSTSNWDSMMQGMATKSIDMSGYRWIECYFCSYGAGSSAHSASGNAVSTIIKVDLEQPATTPLTKYDGVDWRYSGAMMYPDLQLLMKTAEDPYCFAGGVLISSDKKKLLTTYLGFIDSNFVMNPTSAQYYRLHKIIGYK